MRRASLNHAYRLVWSDVTRTYVAVSENTKSRGKRSAIAAAAALALGAPIANAETVATDAAKFVSSVNENHTINKDVKVSASNADKSAVIIGASEYSATFENKGTIESHNIGAVSGLHFLETVSGEVINAGKISASSGTPDTRDADNSASAKAIYIEYLSGVANNAGNIVSASYAVVGRDASAYGIYANAGSAAQGAAVNNASEISATAEGTTAKAVGINVATTDVSVSNTGTIKASASADGGEGYSAHAAGIVGGTSAIVNKGDIIVSAKNSGGVSVNSSNGNESIAYGIDGRNANDVKNESNILASATSNGSAAVALGIAMEGVSGTVDNSGTITTSSSGGSAFAAGILVREGTVSGTGKLLNSGQIVSVADGAISSTSFLGDYSDGRATASGIYAGGAIEGHVENGASIAASATSAHAFAEASGIYAGSGLIGSAVLRNAGQLKTDAVSAAAAAKAYSIIIHNGVEENASLINSGALAATAKGKQGTEASGVHMYGRLAGKLENSGSIFAEAKSSESTATANGIYVDAGVHGSIGNASTGSIMVGASGLSALAAGMLVGYETECSSCVSMTSGPGARVSNEGTIAASAAGSSRARAFGMLSVFQSAADVLANNGSITAVAAGSADAEDDESGPAIAAVGMNVRYAQGTVHNGGSISVSASDGGSTQAQAAGIYVNQLSGGTVSNSGIIHATVTGPGSASSILIDAGNGSVHNLAGGRLIGGINIKSGDIAFSNAGQLILKNGVDLNDVRSTGSAATGNTAGNYSQSATGVLHLAASGAEEGSYSRLTVGGAAAIAGSAHVDVKTVNTLAIGQKLAGVVSAGTLAGDFSSVSDNSAMFSFKSVVNGNGIDLEVGRGITAGQAVSNTRNSAAAGAARVLDGIISSGGVGGDMQNVINALGQLVTEDEVANAVRQTLPLVAGGMSQATSSAISGTSRVVQARQEGQAGRSSGDQFFGDKKVWIKPFGSWADQDNRNGAIGYDGKTYGVVLGTDAELSATRRLGLAFSYAKTDIDSKSGVSQRADVDSYQLMAYGSHSLSDSADLNFQAGFGRHLNEGRRTLDFGGLDRVATARYGSWSANIGAGIARTLALTERTGITPSLRADYTVIRDDAYEETGANALNLNVGKNRTEALVVGLDGKLSHVLGDRATFTANLGAGYDLINDRASITSAFAGAPSAAFTTVGIKQSPWLTRGGLGLVGRVSDSLEVTARYDFELREKFNNQTASVKLRWSY